MTSKPDENEAAPEAKTRPPRKRLQFFHARDASPVQDHMPVLGVDAGVMAGLKVLDAANASGDPNHGSRTVLLFREPGDSGMSLTYVWFKSGYILPRHSHDTDCLYYVMAGELQMGAQILRKGDGMFIPAEAGYTYQAGPEGVEVLEFRNATRFSFLFKNNGETHWQRIAEVFRRRGDAWQDEPPPSER
ncbi:cupin domain-containing protein [Solimonas terrae]|uniref:Cupin domain-containing protein n=1 Tax=Solimonas terrae TaxID=1396819 RepID=A0A6M2BN47_9GAMM|nr:cupin domain-containing protein [Solimonas terrae]NGY04036.1 cupin domain-containing protein [Solimonas terrae]